MNDSAAATGEKPYPLINALTQPYWQAIARGELRLQRCQACQHWIHFPEPRCPQCGSRSLKFELTSGKGVIETFSVVHRSFVEGYKQEPYTIAWVSLPEQQYLRVMSNIINCSVADIAIGKAVKLCFEQRGEFGQIPQFSLTKTS